VFTEGSILFFDPFYFRNGNTAKAKFFIVLRVLDDKVVLATLPSSQDYVPATVVDAEENLALKYQRQTLTVII
jgi:hypothetical protein